MDRSICSSAASRSASIATCRPRCCNRNFATLEPPAQAISVDVAQPLEQSVEQIRAALNA
jgi:hypothetical protein